MNDKRILLDNVSILHDDPDKGYKRKVIKNLNLNLELNSIVSIIASDNYDRHLIGQVLNGKVKTTEGQIRFMGSYFNNKTQYRGVKSEYITLDKINSIKNDKNIGEFLKENILNKKFNKKNYGSTLKEYKLELKNLSKELKDLSNDKKVSEKLINEKKSELQGRAIKKFKDLYKEQKSLNLIQEFKDCLHDNEIFIKTSNKKLEKEIIYTKEFYLGKEKSLKVFNKNNLKQIKEIRNKERDEIINNKSKNSVERDIENLIFSRTKRELKNLHRYILSLNTPNLEFKKTFIKSIENLIESKQNDTYYKKIEKVLKEVSRLTSFVNKDIYLQIKHRISFMKNILDPKSPINSREFNNLLNYIEKSYVGRRNYFYKAIDDIELQLEALQLKNKQERINSIREVWEHKIISLRFQAQIYRERIVVLNNQKAMIDEYAIAHNDNNTNHIYKYIFESENTLHKIDLALNRWRFKRQVLLLKLNSKICVENLKIDNEKIKKQISKIKSTLKHGGNFKIYKNAYIQSFINEHFKRIEANDLTLAMRKSIEKRKEDTKTRIKELNELINKLEIKMDTNNFENQELTLTYLLDDIFFDTDLLENTMDETSISQKQRLSLVKSILEGKEVIILEDPKYDIDLNAKSEIAKSIKNIVYKHNVMIILLTSDIKIAQATSDRIAFMNNGTVYEKGDLGEVIQNPTHPFTKQIIERALEQKFGRLKEFDVGTLRHSAFSILKNFEIGKDHTIFCTEEELTEWGVTKWEL